MKRIYVIYDGRAADGDTDKAVVMDTAGSIEKARTRAKAQGDHNVIYSYAITGKNPYQWTDETFEEIVP